MRWRCQKDFLQTVVELDSAKFEKLISKKPQGEVWVVDYFAGWCGPCQDMAPAYRKFARMMANHPLVHVASIDCAKHSDVCRQQGINSYPTIKLYPASGFGVQSAVWVTSLLALNILISCIFNKISHIYFTYCFLCYRDIFSLRIR